MLAESCLTHLAKTNAFISLVAQCCIEVMITTYAFLVNIVTEIQQKDKEDLTSYTISSQAVKCAILDSHLAFIFKFIQF